MRKPDPWKALVRRASRVESYGKLAAKERRIPWAVAVEVLACRIRRKGARAPEGLTRGEIRAVLDGLKVLITPERAR